MAPGGLRPDDAAATTQQHAGVASASLTRSTTVSGEEVANAGHRLAASSGLQGITRGPGQSLWFTEYNGNAVGRMTTAGAVTLVPLPKPHSVPDAIARGSEGAI